MNKKKIIGLCGVVAILIAFFSTMFIHNTISEKNQDEKVSGNKSGVYFSEAYNSQEQLIEKSDLVVKCEFKGEKETKRVTGMTSDDKGEQFEVSGTVTRYKMKTVEVLKGSADKEITMLIAGEGDERLQKGEEYVLFLTKNPDGSYLPLSYAQGLNKVEKDDEIQSIESKDKMNYNDLKEKIEKSAK